MGIKVLKLFHMYISDVATEDKLFSIQIVEERKGGKQDDLQSHALEVCA